MLTDTTLYLLFFIIHFIGTLAYAPRITGILSGRLSLSISLSNILSIFSRSASVIMIPILSKKIESQLLLPGVSHSIPDQYLIFFAVAAVASVVGMFSFEATIRVIYRTVLAYTPADNMMILLASKLFGKRSSDEVPIPYQKDKLTRTDWSYLALNTCITCIYTSATLAAIYSAYIVPQYRVTSLSFAFIINGAGTFIFVTMIDPYVSSLTDMAIADRTSFPEFYFRIRCFLWSRLAGMIISLATFHLFVYIITRGIWLIR